MLWDVRQILLNYPSIKKCGAVWKFNLLNLFRGACNRNVAECGCRPSATGIHGWWCPRHRCWSSTANLWVVGALLPTTELGLWENATGAALIRKVSDGLPDIKQPLTSVKKTLIVCVFFRIMMHLPWQEAHGNVNAPCNPYFFCCIAQTSGSAQTS